MRSDAADSFNSTLTWSGSAGGTSIDSAAADGYASFRVMRNNNSSGSFADGMYIGYANNNSGVTRIYGGGATSGALTVHGSGDVRINGFTAWHSGNDGSGSGLDADTVDGTHVAELVTTNTTQTIAATKTFNLSGYDINLDYDNVRNLVRIQRQGTEKFMLGAAGNEIKINTSNSGFLSFGTSLLPQSDGSVDLGSSSKRWANLYTADAHFSNVGLSLIHI